MERAGYEVSKEHGELSKELRTSGSCKMGYTTNCLKKYIAPETWSLEDGISSSFLRPLAVPGCRCCHQCPLLLRLFLWNLYHERRPLKNPVDACISNSRLFCYFNFILASAGPWGPWQVSSLFSMPLKLIPERAVKTLSHPGGQVADKLSTDPSPTLSLSTCNEEDWIAGVTPKRLEFCLKSVCLT